MLLSIITDNKKLLGVIVCISNYRFNNFANLINIINIFQALLYLISLLDPIVKGDYVIVYFHTLTSSNNYPSFSWLREVYNILPYKYKKNLKAFYIVHPTFWTKVFLQQNTYMCTMLSFLVLLQMMTWWFTTFMAPAIKQKVHSLPGVEYLYSVMSRDQLEIPAYITEYDMSVSRNFFVVYITVLVSSVIGYIWKMLTDYLIIQQFLFQNLLIL